jgi:hypothetical protein
VHFSSPLMCGAAGKNSSRQYLFGTRQCTPEGEFTASRTRYRAGSVLN